MLYVYKYIYPTILYLWVFTQDNLCNSKAFHANNRVLCLSCATPTKEPYKISKGQQFSRSKVLHKEIQASYKSKRSLIKLAKVSNFHDRRSYTKALGDIGSFVGVAQERQSTLLLACSKKLCGNLQLLQTYIIANFRAPRISLKEIELGTFRP